MTTRSGRRKSSTAAPSLRNSGLFTTTTRCGADATIARTRAAVPTGTVLLSTTIAGAVTAFTTSRTAASTYCRSGAPVGPSGVPTAMKTAAAPRTASACAVVNERRFSRIARCMRSPSPGS